MNILSVNTGVPRSYTLDGVTIETSMVRSPQKQIDIKFSHIENDVFKSPKIHGITEAIVYAFSVDRYEYWSKYLGYKTEIGFFGENLSVDTLREQEIFLEDEYQAGSSLLKVTGPRYPCSRLNFVSGNKMTQKHFAETAWPGVYFQVLTEGQIKPQDKLILRKRNQNKISVLDLFLALRSRERQELISNKIEEIINSPHVLEKYVDKLKGFYKK